MSADYPEKVMLACIRDMGDHPCPRCYISSKKLDQMGTIQDMKYRAEKKRVFNNSISALISKARTALYGLGRSFASTAVDKVLKPKSLVPTMNAFAAVLDNPKVDHHRMLAIDFMHEFELGVWKSIVHHLVRILALKGEPLVREFDRRLRETPGFGASVIRKMRNNVSQFKKFAARDYEDLLQVIIPAIEGLLSEAEGEVVMGLLYVLATYHALGKLRLHTSDTLRYWDNVTFVLGRFVRSFRDDVCQHLATKETPREAQARARRAAKAGNSRIDSSTRSKPFNISTYKFHALGDGPSTVRMFGTTDSYSTWIGELLHRRPKGHYRRTAKNKTSTLSITKMDAREETLMRLGQQYKPYLPKTFQQSLKNAPKRKPETIFPLENHYQIAKSTNDFFEISRWLTPRLQSEQIATLDFVVKLKNHLLSRIEQAQVELNFPSFGRIARTNLILRNDRIYTHRKLRIHYTTYDVRRSLDIINLNSGKLDVVVTSSDAAHPFGYARVKGIFHVYASYNDAEFTRFDVLWVRWFKRCSVREDFPLALERLQIEPSTDHQFGFLDPGTIVRACHIIPAWCSGEVAEQDTEEFSNGVVDFRFYYVNRFVDRDMFMRYLGGGVGHVGGGAQKSFQGNTEVISINGGDLSDDDFPADQVEGPAVESIHPAALEEYGEEGQSSLGDDESDKDSFSGESEVTKDDENSSLDSETEDSSEEESSAYEPQSDESSSDIDY